MQRIISISILLISLLGSCWSKAQKIVLSTAGNVDLHQIIVTQDNKKLPFSIFPNHSGFAINYPSPQPRHLIVSYQNKNIFDSTVSLEDTTYFYLHFHSQSHTLATVVVASMAENTKKLETIPTDELSGRALLLTRGLSLGEALKTLPGVNSLESGPNISKPIIHGVYNNRVLTLNNGVRQEGQNWGNDHAPEIDPFISNKISVIKGPASLRYGSDAIGGVIMVETPPLLDTGKIHGEMNLVGMSNGYGGTASGMLQGRLTKLIPHLSWRLQGTTQINGNTKAATYYIPNTGFRQSDMSLGLGYHRSNFGVDGYFSYFYTKLGIKPTSEDLTYSDFLAAIQRGRPSADLSRFTYAIPQLQAHQLVNHRIYKLNGFWQWPKAGRLEWIVSHQQDARKEFGLDPLSDPTLPFNTFDLRSNTVNLQWLHPRTWIHNLSGQIGLDYMDSKNTSTTRERFEVIPSYVSRSVGAFWIEKYKLNRFLIEGGLRFDHKYQNASIFRRGNALDNTVDRFYDSTGRWNKVTTNLGATYSINSNWSLMYNMGTAWRAPSPLELYANGIHQGASRWEVGDPNLKVESALNNNFEVKYQGHRLSADLGLYANFFHNYIYIQRDSLIQTIAGYYPKYLYKQTPNALFTGIDFKASYQISDHWQYTTQASIVRGRDRFHNDWLIYIPADHYFNSLQWQSKSWGKIAAPFLMVDNTIVARQTRFPPSNSTSEPNPPAGYTLWGATMGGTVHWGAHPLQISIQSTNLLNKEYKDYLNLFRFYNHNPGRNIILRLRYVF